MDPGTQLSLEIPVALANKAQLPRSVSMLQATVLRCTADRQYFLLGLQFREPLLAQQTGLEFGKVRVQGKWVPHGENVFTLLSAKPCSLLPFWSSFLPCVAHIKFLKPATYKYYAHCFAMCRNLAQEMQFISPALPKRQPW
jgi:hypothetical protein